MTSQPQSSSGSDPTTDSPATDSPATDSLRDGFGPIPLLDLSRENGLLHDEIQDAIEAVCRSGAFVLGPATRDLESSVAQLTDTEHGIGCASGSDALLLALMALDVGEGDEVILPSFTFFATASAVTRLGARPVFVDIDPLTYNLDVEEVASQISSATKAIIPVHLFGQSADMTAVMELANRHGLGVVEDAAQAIGAKHKGRPVGSWGHIGCFSFYPTKNLGGFGDGGMLVTSDDNLAERLRLLRGHGMKPRYVHREVGINSRLDSIQAAALNVKLPHLADWTEARRKNADQYRTLWHSEDFENVELATVSSLPTVADSNDHVWNQFTIRILDGMRDSVRQYLANHQVGTEIYYPIPLHRQRCFADLGYAVGSLPHTEQAAQEVLSLPVYPYLTDAEQRTVVRHIVRFFESNASRLNDYRAA